jgi:hypothetical protein
MWKCSVAAKFKIRLKMSPFWGPTMLTCKRSPNGKKIAKAGIRAITFLGELKNISVYKGAFTLARFCTKLACLVMKFF